MPGGRSRGSRAQFNREQVWLMWTAIGSMVAWLFYGGVVAQRKWINMDGNPRKLMRRHTGYQTWYEYAYGEHALVMVMLTAVFLLAAGAFLVRGYRDDWEFLHG